MRILRRGLGRKILETCEKAARQAGYDRFELTATLMGRALPHRLGQSAPICVDQRAPALLLGV